ncbi:MAG: PDZ domain-containing protein [Anaerolineaceae bacterium]|nr:PDZ domain-containing protein [Anaerolineaceae bacterium]
MRRFILAGLFVIALLSMLCIGFALGAVFSPALERMGEVIQQGFNRTRIDPFNSRRFEIHPPQNERGQLPAVPPDFSFGPGLMHPGALIREVVPGSPAEQAGLKTGQMIQAVDGTRLDSANTLPDIIAAHKPGDTITLTIFDPGVRNNQTRDIKVKLAENPEKAGAAWLGIRFASIDINSDPDKSPGE